MILGDFITKENHINGIRGAYRLVTNMAVDFDYANEDGSGVVAIFEEEKKKSRRGYIQRGEISRLREGMP